MRRRSSASRNSTSQYLEAATSFAAQEQARELIGFRGVPLGAIFGTSNSLANAGVDGPFAPASIQALSTAISSAESFLRLPGGMIFGLPFFSKRPSTIWIS